MSDGGVLLTAFARAYALDQYTFGTRPFMPEFPTHGCLRSCPYCDRTYRVHAGFADHRDECAQGPWGDGDGDA